MHNAARGDKVVNGAGQTGIFVGIHKGLVWVAWDAADFTKMCGAFDAMMRRAMR